MSLYNFINLIRYKSYLKNLIIFLPLFLNYTSWSITNFGKLVLPVIFFSFLASSIYIINDLTDLEIDKKHKSKKLRPLASGLIKSKTAIFISLFLAIISLLFFFKFSDFKIFILGVLYFIINFFLFYLFKKNKIFRYIYCLKWFFYKSIYWINYNKPYNFKFLY